MRSEGRLGVRWFYGVIAAIVLLAIALGGAGLSARQSQLTFDNRLAQVTAKLGQILADGTDPAAVAGLRKRLAAIQASKWRPVPYSWLPTHDQRAHLDAVMADAGAAERASIALARQGAETALAALLAADPGVTADSRVGLSVQLEAARTPNQIRQVEASFIAAAGVAAGERQLAVDLEPKANDLRNEVQKAQKRGVDTGQAEAVLAEYDGLLKLAAAQIPGRVPEVSAHLDSASAALTEAMKPPPPPPPASPAPNCRPELKGRVVIVDLSAQSLIAYQDGCPIMSSLVTTGRAGMRTITGTFHIILMRAPYRFVSGYQPGDPRYYAPATVNWAAEFDSGGYFLHDWPNEHDGSYGPGSENGPHASHGCVHVPESVMGKLYDWLQPGDTVIVH